MAWNAAERLIAITASHLSSGKLLDRRDVLDAGVVHQDVHAAQLARRLGDHPRDLDGLRHVGGAVGRLHLVLGPELRDQLVDQRLVAESVQHDVRAGGRERPRDAEPDAARRACDQRDFAGQAAGFPRLRAEVPDGIEREFLQHDWSFPPPSFGDHVQERSGRAFESRQQSVGVWLRFRLMHHCAFIALCIAVLNGNAATVVANVPATHPDDFHAPAGLVLQPPGSPLARCARRNWPIRSPWPYSATCRAPAFRRGCRGRPFYFNNSAAESVTFPGSADERTIGATYS